MLKSLTTVEMSPIGQIGAPDYKNNGVGGGEWRREVNQSLLESMAFGVS
jgi:hypothetical protein